MKATDSVPHLLDPFSRLAGRLPQLPHSLAAATVLNLGLGARLGADTLAALRGKVVRIAVRDAGIRCTLHYDGRVFMPRSSRAAADVTIAASLQDFALLVMRREDPDTLFFARRLTIEGDTELGLRVKNALDALDTSKLTELLDRVSALARPGGQGEQSYRGS